MKTIQILLAMFFIVAPVYAKNNSNVDRSVVLVIVTYQKFDPLMPWTRKQPSQRVGYGTVIGDSLILTTEDLVRNHKLIEIRLPESGEKIHAVLENSDSQTDLALLRVPKNKAFSNTQPIALSDQMQIHSDVNISQFDNTSKVQNSIAHFIKISMGTLPNAPYQALITELLSDVNINGRGCPVTVDNKLAGIIVGSDSHSRIARMLPAFVLKHFIDDCQTPPYKGFASAGFLWKALIDPAKRAYIGASDANQGILVVSCMPETGASDAFQPNDVILEWDGIPIDNMGYYNDSDLGRLMFSNLIRYKKEPGDVVKVKIIRDKKQMDVDVKLHNWKDEYALIPENVEGKPEPYIVNGGFIIRELTGQYINAHSNAWKERLAPNIGHLYMTDKYDVSKPGDRVVFIAGVLPDPINMDYQIFQNELITAVNGQSIRNIEDIFKIMDKGETINRITLKSVAIDIVLDTSELANANQRLAYSYRIPSLFYRGASDQK